MNRRGFLGAMLAACAAPALVRSESIMRIKPIILPGDTEYDFFVQGGECISVPEVQYDRFDTLVLCNTGQYQIRLMQPGGTEIIINPGQSAEVYALQG